MIDARHQTSRSVLIALVVTATIGVLGASGASAASFGGLGRVAEGKITPGSEGKPGQVNPSNESQHNFAIDPATGDLYVADEVVKQVEKSGKLVSENFARLQKFSPEGTFIAENSVALPESSSGEELRELGGIAIGNEKVYLLVNEERPIEEAAPLFDSGLKAADAIWSFSTKELKKELLTKEAKELKPLVQESKGPLIEPAGIAVDPKTHDIVIYGQQDEAKEPGTGEEFRAAVERVHLGGVLGPRYVDSGDCLDDGEPSVAEKACAEKTGAEQPRSPIVTPQGSVYLEEEGEIWEIPMPASGEEPFKRVSSQPHRVFTLGSEQSLLAFAGLEHQAGTMSFASLPGGKGRIYVAANLRGGAGESTESAVVVLNWEEKGEGAEVTELGWTGGQSAVSGEHSCAIPVAGTTPVVAAGKGEEVLVFDSNGSAENKFVDLFAFGPGEKAEACGHVTSSPPVVEVGEEKNAMKVETGIATKITSSLTGANAKSTKWKLLFTPRSGTKTEEVLTSGYQFQRPVLEHAFLGVGKYEISEIVETDSLGTPTVEAKAGQPLETFPLTVKITPHGSVAAGEEVTLEATVTDNKSSTPQLKYTWSFGDGSAPVVQEETAKSSKTVDKVKHAFASRCSPAVACTVTLEVEDLAAKAGEKARTEIAVGESQAEREARQKAEQAAREAREAAERAQKAKEAAEAAQRAAAAAALQQHEREAREKAEREHQEVLAFQAKHNPEARIAGTALSVKKNGTLVVKVACPGTEAAACIGTVTLRTLTPVKVGKKKSILTLATFSFTIVGSQTRAVTVHLSTKARTMLLQSHSLRARATVVAHDTANVTRSTTATVTLRLAKH